MSSDNALTQFWTKFQNLVLCVPDRTIAADPDENLYVARARGTTTANPTPPAGDTMVPSSGRCVSPNPAETHFSDSCPALYRHSHSPQPSSQTENMQVMNHAEVQRASTAAGPAPPAENTALPISSRCESPNPATEFTSHIPLAGSSSS